MGRFSCFQPLARNSKTKKSCRHSLEALHERVLQVNGSSQSSLESISVEERNEKLQVDGLSPPSVDSTMPTTTVEAIPEKVQVNGLRQPSVDSTMPNSADPVHMKLQVNGLSRPSVDSSTPTTSEEAVPETVQVNGLSHPSADLVISSSSNSLTLNSGGTQINNEINDGTGLVPVEPVCNSEDMNSISKKSVGEFRRTASLKKIKSTGCDNQWRIAYADDVTEDETDSNCLCDNHCDQYRLLGINDDGRVDVSRSSIFSITDAHENADSPITNENIGDSNGHKMLAAAEIPKSHSKPSIHPLKTSAKCVSLWRSCNDLRVLDTRQDALSPEFDKQARPARDRGCVNCKEANVDDGNRAGVARDWIMPVCNEANLAETREGECSIQCRDELAGVDFKIKRIEEWMNDLQHCDPLEKSNESSESTDLVSRDTKYPPAKLESPQVTAGTEAAASYMSAPSANATSAQFVNQGLVAIPFLSAFSSLKVLNLSANAIVRINAGNLPRGLHILNLSKNSISTIEGLRELTRLRVLDLSYNRIIRIGHGLASCSSLKELYLAGNKISEVEGLHRVLKLNLLDLRYNKISTANCLGQLAANYGSLQAINLEGNPAQKNVGDEHLKKFLQSLLPRLAFYNRQPIKAGILKCTGERKIVKLGPSSHPFDCSSRIDKKSIKKGCPASSCRKLTTSHSVELRNDMVVQLPTSHSKRQH